MLPDITFEGGARNAQNLSAQKASASEGARLQKKNENAERKKRTEKKTRQRQKTSFLLIFSENQQNSRGVLPRDPATGPCIYAVGRLFLKIFARMGKQPCGDPSLIRQERPKRHKKTGEKREKNGEDREVHVR